MIVKIQCNIYIAVRWSVLVLSNTQLVCDSADMTGSGMLFAVMSDGGTEVEGVCRDRNCPAKRPKLHGIECDNQDNLNFLPVKREHYLQSFISKKIHTLFFADSRLLNHSLGLSCLKPLAFIMLFLSNYVSLDR